MADLILYKIKKTYLKLLKAWAKGKSKKAIRLQHELLELELKRKK
jgi:hypothetical protein